MPLEEIKGEFSLDKGQEQIVLQKDYSASSNEQKDIIKEAEVVSEVNMEKTRTDILIEKSKVNYNTVIKTIGDMYERIFSKDKSFGYTRKDLFADYDYFNERTGALKMFKHIKENQIFYKTYFKLCYDDKHLVSIYDTRRAEQEHIDSNINYHIEFFRNGLNAIIKLWLAGGCAESPEEMAEVLKQEYRGR